ncbi:hypothetical protein NDU88_004330 [Pleurodeles waltl]|uniref:Uncharacterized protein n=1 Tax=Pleurodeles waltl TaxID=8319 RepID=A0AAV7NKQ2_PLEWA|nr:hypothetical protein NDU88_004330 [Pleurodeles waltl]
MVAALDGLNGEPGSAGEKYWLRAVDMAEEALWPITLGWLRTHRILVYGAVSVTLECQIAAAGKWLL